MRELRTRAIVIAIRQITLLNGAFDSACIIRSAYASARIVKSHATRRGASQRIIRTRVTKLNNKFTLLLFLSELVRMEEDRRKDRR